MENSTPLNFKRLLPILIVPIISLGWSLYVLHASFPFFIKGIDPEYPYLINGLNFAQLQFNLIGHTDHPGTPFQLFIAIVLRIVHLFAGKGTIALDVLQRPEFYLQAVSVSIAILQSLLLSIIGIIGMKSHNLLKSIILQLTPFYSIVLLDLTERCNPDRFLLLVTLLFIIVLLKFYFSSNKNPLKLAIWSGIVMGLGFAVKINYLPLLILPFFILGTWKLRGIYAGSTLLSFILLISPIIDKFIDFRRFVEGIITHDGLYGSGASNAFNTNLIVQNLKTIFIYNNELYAIIGALLILLIISFTIKNRKKNIQYYLFIYGSLLVAILQFLIVAKHFKNYYLIPLFSFYGILFFIMVTISESFQKNKKLVYLFLLLPAFSFINTLQKSVLKNELNSHAETQEMAGYINTQLNKDDYWFIEPTWLSGPLVENALIYGLSYCRHREVYEDELVVINPNILTYEDENKAPKRWRASVIAFDSILLSNKNILILSTLDRNANKLVQQIQNEVGPIGIKLQIDTIFNQKSTNSQIIQVKCDFENSEINQELISKPETNELSEFDQEVKKIVFEIMQNPQLLNQIEQKAIKRGFTLDSMLYLDAVYTIKKYR